jgi:thioredoxin 1
MIRSRRVFACSLLIGILAGACTTPGAASLAPASASTPPASVAAPTPAPSTAPPATAAPTASPAAQASASAAGWILYDPGLDAPAAIDAALAQAKVDGKRVLLDFGADWCPDCHVLDSYFEDPRAQAILEDSYHVVHIDVGYFDKNLESATKYGNNVIAVGIPSVVILDAKGTKLVDTAAGELADSRRYTADDIVKFLSSWAG